MKNPNRLMEDEFEEWLEKCPNEWLRIDANKDSSSFLFYRRDGEED